MSNPPEKKATQPRRWRWRTALFLILAPFVLGVAAFAAIQTPWVKAFVTTTAAGMIGPMIGQEIEISGLRGFVPFRIELSRFAMADAEGEWLAVEDIRLAWSWRALLGGRVVVEALSVQRATLPRIGEFPESEEPPGPPEPFSLPSIPQLPAWLEVKALAIERFEIGEAVLQEDAVFALNGSLLQPRGGQRATLDLDLTRLDADTTNAALHIALSDAALAVDIRARDDSILPRILGLDGPAELALRGDAPPGDWHGTLSAAIGHEPLVDGTLGLRIAEGLDATARLTLNAAHPLVPEAVLEQVGGQVGLVLALRLDEDGRVHLEEIAAEGGALHLTVAGLLDLPGDALDLRVVARHDDLGPLVGIEPEMGPQPVEASLHIQGSPANLGIGIDASWEGAPLAHGTLTIGLEGGLAIGADLRVIPPELFLPSAEAAAMISDGIQITADIPSLSGEHIRIAALDITGIEGFTLHADADLDFENGDGRADFTLEAALGELAFLTGLDMAGSLSAKVEAQGTGERMDIVAAVSGETVRFMQYAIESLNLSLDGGLDGWADGDPRGMSAAWEGDALGLALAPYPGERLRIEGSVEAPTLDEINLPRLFLSDGVMEVEASGQFLPATASGSFDLTANADSFAPYGELLGTDLNGVADIRLTAQLDEGGESGLAELDARLTQLTGLPEPAQGLIGSSLTAQARATLADGLATLESFALNAAHVNASGGGSYALEPGAVDAQLTLSVTDLAAARATLGPDASGSLRVEAQASGTLDAMTANARVAGTNVGAAGAHADELELDITASGLPDAPTGRFTLRAVERGQQLDAEAAFALADAVVSATGVTLTLGGNRLDADGSYHLETGLPEVSAEFTFDDLAAFEPFAGVALGGSVRGDLAVTPTNGDAAAHIALEAVDVVAPFGSVSNLTISGSVSELLSAPAGSLNATLVALDAGAVRVDTLSAVVEGGMASVNLEAETAGSIAEAAPFNLRLVAGAEPEEGRASIQVLEGVLERYPITLENPSAFNMDDDGIRLDPLVIRLGEGRLEAHATQTPERVDARIVWTDLPLGIANAFGAPEVAGTAQGAITLTGPLDEPLLEVLVEIVEVRTALALEPDAPVVSAAVSARLSATDLNADARIGMSDETRIDAEVALPVVFSLAPFTFEIPEDAALDARILGDLLPRDPLSFAGLVDHQVKGVLTIDYRVQGTVSAPNVQGTARMEDGRYENAVTSTVLDAIDLRFESNGADLVASLRATDGGTGEITANAEAALDPGRNFPFAIDGTLSEMVVVRRDDATARVDGTLDASGDLSAFAVNGDLLIGPANIVLAIPRGGRIPEVEYTEVKGGMAAFDEEEEVTGVETPMEITLNINTRFPNRVHIRGPGLDSEWTGEISVTGTASEPSVRGELRVLRGTLDLLNRRFELTDSLIVLDGSTPPNPYINVRGQTRAAEVTAFILITGTPDALNLRLESDPPLPQDEVLSRVLFDRPIEEISPLQALQLAREASQLSGTFRGGSILGAGGGLLPIDRLDIHQDFEGTGQTAIGAGAYLGDDIYVEVRQRLQSGSTAVSIDVELRRNFSVRGEVRSDGRTGAGIEYKRDY